MTAQEALATAKKHHFWIISVVVVLIAVLCWQIANSAVSDEYAKRKSIIEGKFKQVADIQAKKDHPNELFAKGVQVEHDVLKKMTLTAWIKLHDRQKERLIWPDVISPRFTRIVPKLPLDEEIPADLREQYMNFIRDEFPNLYEIIDVRKLVTVKADKKKAKPEAKGRAPGGMGLAGPGNMGQREQEWIGKVAWDEKHRDNLESHYIWRKTPTTKQVRYAQEDLWIYAALLKIIANTNGSQKEHLFMPVKRINALDVGRDASVAISAGMKGTGKGAAGMGAGASGAPGGMGAAGMPGANAADPKAGDKALDDLRFVDDKCVPISGGDKLPYAEFKMVPVRFSLVMNQMKVSDLLVHCANSPLPVEIRRWRVNPSGENGVIRPDQSSGGGAGATGGMPGAQRMGGGGGQAGGGQGMVGLAGGGRRAGNEAEVAPDDVEVEVIGMVYLFNPPDIAKLGTGGEGQPGAAASPPAAGQDQTKPVNEPGVVPPVNPPDAEKSPPEQPAAGRPVEPASDKEGDQPGDDARPPSEEPAEEEGAQPADEEMEEGAGEEAEAKPEDETADG